MPEPAAQGHRARLSEPGAGAPGPAEPTLPELLAAGWRRAGRRGRIAGIAAALLLALVVVLFAFARGGGEFSYDGPEAPAFSLSWGGLDLLDAGEGELVRLEADDEELTIAPLAFEPPPSASELLPALGLAAEPVARDIRRRFPGARVVLEGRTLLAVDRGPEAYQLAFTAPTGPGEIVIGKRLLVPDGDRPGQGVAIEISERTRDPAVIEKVGQAPAGFFLNWPIQLLLEDAASIRTQENLEQPLRSFGFG